MPRLTPGDRRGAGRRARVAGTAVLVGLLLGVPAIDAPGRAAQASSFDDLLRRLADAPAELRSAAVFHYLNLVGGTPLVEGQSVVFLAERDGPAPPRIVGAFNDWGRAAPGEGVVSGVMHPIEGTEWYWVRLALEPGSRVDYAIAYGDRIEPDPLNPRVVERDGQTRSWVALPPRGAPQRDAGRS